MLVSLRELLITFSAAYHSKQLTVPIDWLSEILVFDSKTQLLKDLRYYKCDVSEDRSCVTFNKTSFDRTVNEVILDLNEIIKTLF